MTDKSDLRVWATPVQRFLFAALMGSSALVFVSVTSASCSSKPAATGFQDDTDAAGDDAAPVLLPDGAVAPTDGGSFNLDGATRVDAAGSTGALTMIVRDFRVYDGGDTTTDPDFENPPFNIGNDGGPSPGFMGSWYDTEIVAPALGADHTPTYKHPGQTTVTTHGEAAFQKWYHDVPGTNSHIEVPIQLHSAANGVYGYDSTVDGVFYDGNIANGKGFFPIDDGSPYATPFGNQGYAHNFSFTVEIHTTFTYHGGEYFQFRGDDDVFVFINGAIVINLGGIHDPQPAQVSLDTLGLTVGDTYPLDFFSAERHVYGSNVEISTTLALVPSIPK